MKTMPSLIGLPVTEIETGLQLGVLTDICFDRSTGELKAYLLSDGIITDLLYRRMAIPIPHSTSNRSRPPYCS